MGGTETPRVVLVGAFGRFGDRLRAGLASLDFEVATAGSAADCLRLLEEGAVDGVVSSESLPDLDADLLCRSVRVCHPTLPFLVVPTDGPEAVEDGGVAADEYSTRLPDRDPAVVASHLRDHLDRIPPGSGAETHQRYGYLVSTTQVPINLFDETGESIWCNAATLELLGLDDRTEIIGHSIFEFIHAADLDLAREELVDVIGMKESVGPTQMRLRRRDGEVRHVRVSTAVGRFLDADIGQAVILDVTSLQETKEALRRERQFVETALDTLQDVFYVVDAGGRLLRWNGAVTEVTGYGDDELASLEVTALFAASDASRVRGSIERILEEGTDTVEATLVTGHGRAVPYELRGRRLREDASRAVVVGRDVTERKERNRQLKMLEQWLRHNIRNEINVVQGIAENIAENRTDDVAASARRIIERTEHVVAQADRERRFVELLTDPPDQMAMDVTELVERQVRSARDRYPAARIEVARADEFRALAIPDLDAAVGELVENAVEYNDTGTPTVDIEVVAGDGRGTVRLLDDGPGIPDIEWETLLHDREIDQLHHSSGLGLLYVYWVARLSGGELDIAANDPRGSVVSLTLPAAVGQ